MKTRRLAAFLTLTAVLTAGAAHGQARIEPVTSVAGLEWLNASPGGRVRETPEGWLYQWPGAHFEAAFSGDSIVFGVGQGRQILNVTVDGEPVSRMVAPNPGRYRIAGLAEGEHTVRVDVVSELVGGSAGFGGFLTTPGSGGQVASRPDRQIEFIGDSHTVGYGVRSATRDCTANEIWAATDNSLTYGPLTAGRLEAEYQINAISGRGVTRNYNGVFERTLPQAYRYDTFDRSRIARDPDWRPQVVVINLGTNDFSTPLREGEQWPTREALREDFSASYVRFVMALHERYKGAYFILLTPPSEGGEIAWATDEAARRLTERGEIRLALLRLPVMELTACDGHPSERDQIGMAEVVSQFLQDRPGIWAR